VFFITIDYFEDLLKKPSLFKNESKLDINYVTKKLPHREKELALLSQLFLVLITNPNSLSRKILIIGKTGIGKTAAIKLFGEMVINAAEKRSILIKYVHINCRKERTSYKVLIKIIRALNKNFPKRGYSPQDLLDIIVDSVNNQNLQLLIVLDELGYLINKGGDLIYSLTRINDDSYNARQCISIIGIARDISCLSNLDESTMSTLQRNIIKFNDYTKEQLYDILKYRAEISLKENSISNKLIITISDLVYQSGDVRYGLNLLWKSSKIAESQDLIYHYGMCTTWKSRYRSIFYSRCFKIYEITESNFLISNYKSFKKKWKDSNFFNSNYKFIFDFMRKFRNSTAVVFTIMELSSRF